MINLAKQNQYVEFAEKDSKSRNIAEKIDELDAKPAGTKLYRHQLVLVPSSSSTPITISLDVITTSSNSFNVQGGPPVPRISSGIILNANWGNGSDTSVSYNSGAIYSATITISNNKTVYSFASCTISSDTVTAL